MTSRILVTMFNAITHILFNLNNLFETNIIKNTDHGYSISKKCDHVTIISVELTKLLSSSSFCFLFQQYSIAEKIFYRKRMFLPKILTEIIEYSYDI